MAVIKAVSGGASSIGDLVSYLTKDEKTRCDLMTGVNCSADNAVQEMDETKIFYDKRGGRQYKHFIQSFSPDEELVIFLQYKSDSIPQKFPVRSPSHIRSLPRPFQI